MIKVNQTCVDLLSTHSVRGVSVLIKLGFQLVAKHEALGGYPIASQKMQPLYKLGS